VKVVTSSGLHPHILWNKPGNQATITIEITDTTLTALPTSSTPAKTDTTTPPPQPDRAFGTLI
jgi:hypothetical protein